MTPAEVLKKIQNRVERPVWKNMRGDKVNTLIDDLFIFSKSKDEMIDQLAWLEVFKKNIEKFDFRNPALKKEILQRFEQEKIDIKQVFSDSKVNSELQQSQPFGKDINQKGYGSCQILAVCDSISRQKGGKEYLESLVTEKADGSNDVRLYNRFGKPFTVNVHPRDEIELKDKVSLDRASDLKDDDLRKQLSADAPQVIKIIELAYVKVREDEKAKLQFNLGSENLIRKFSKGYPASMIIKTDSNKIDYLNLSSIDKSLENKLHIKTLRFQIPDSDEINIDGFKIRNNHEYSFSINYKTGMVSLRNPWNTQKELIIHRDDLEQFNPLVSIAYSKDFSEKLQTFAAAQDAASHVAENNSIYTESQITSKFKSLFNKSALPTKLDRKHYQSSHSDQVEDMQQKLMDIGYLSAKDVNGIFDEKTARVLQKFQLDTFDMLPYNITNIVADHTTMAELNAAALALPKTTPDKPKGII